LVPTNPDISQKYEIGDISKGVANTLARQKKLILFPSYNRIRVKISTSASNPYVANPFGA
jgi:hypothetical protein